ncbi:dienelactone hydrolase family protein [Pseudobacteriovorax antillogorgiicola]|uniref:Dienelactone hydrolase family protein n=1 Tax=Pseudobacteriovorax antillogorgiicola TaxID=1513793 RepID=A0A1Y6BGS4_9BACT|nr:dienelactone hydrolase family protein [Pseudobacteriovorax antillogorgiicola]TCS57464.1 dienelactone hydrolase family protein [Pseudobacteriovorax antillogorgiicola]SMF00741.1 Dienelactone hydrolase family protein [Pseudobacteriovorax antillogorgiicola]
MIQYRLNSKNIIERIAGPWLQANGNQGKVRPETVLGRNIWTFFRGTELISLYSQLFDYVRRTEKVYEVPFRCDSKQFKRLMKLRIEPVRQQAKALDISSTVLQEIKRESLPITDETRIPPQRFLVCAICQRASLSGHVWLDLESFAKDYLIFIENAPPPMGERICPDCLSAQLPADHIVTAHGDVDRFDRVPLILFLHGEAQQEHLFRLQAPPRLVATGQLLDQAPPFYLLTMIKRQRGPWDVRQVMTILNRISLSYPIDIKRIYLTGLSSGGLASWKLIRTYSDVFAGAVIAASTPLGGINLSQLKTPVWVTHGGLDLATSSSRIHRVMSELIERSAEVKCTVFPNQGHDCWSSTYHRNEIWRWLFEKSL